MVRGLLDVQFEGLRDLDEPVYDEVAHLDILRADLQMLLLIRLLLLTPGVDGPQQIRSIQFVQFRVSFQSSYDHRASLGEVSSAQVAVDQVRVTDDIGLFIMAASEI